jgi:hypothetical protein
MKGASAGQRDVGGGQQHREFILAVLMFVADLKAGMQADAIRRSA